MYKKEIFKALDKGVVDYDENANHKEVAGKLQSENIANEASINTVRTTVGEWRRENEGYSRFCRQDSDRGSTESCSGDSTAVDVESGSGQEGPFESPPDEPLGLKFIGEHDPKYNKEGDYWKVYIPCRGKIIQVSGDVDRKIKRMYSNEVGKGITHNEIATKIGWDEQVLKQYRRARGYVHDDFQYTDQEFLDEDTDDLVSSTLAKKKQEYATERNQALWSQIKADARKWNEFKSEFLKRVFAEIKSSPIDKRERVYNSGIRDNFFAFVHATDGHLDQLNADGTGFEENAKRWLSSIKENISRIDRHGSPEKLVLTLGNDQFNTDDNRGKTANGTPQDQSIVGVDSFYEVADCGVEAIEICREVAPVEVRVIPGNHDWRSSTAYAWGLEHKYDGIDTVQVKRPDKWQFGLYGKNLVTFTHGENVKGGETKQGQKLSAVLVHEVPEMVGESTHRYCLLGHLHFILEKQDGVHTLQGGSTVKRDYWHQIGKHGHSHPCQTAYILDKSGGQTVRFTSYVN